MRQEGFENGTKTVFAQKIDKFGKAALFVRAEMIMNMPAQVILPKLAIKFRPAGNNVVQRVPTEIPGFAELAAELAVLGSAPQCPNCVNKGKLG